MIRHLLFSFIIYHLSLCFAEAQDFSIDHFRENTMDMTAATSGVKDLNGNMAALIRFAVRDDKFDFDANLGVLKKEQRTGEIWLFVPQGTRRITISHPVLGVLRGYELPAVMKAKSTYDATITITNEVYLNSLMQQAAQGSEGAQLPITNVNNINNESITTGKAVSSTEHVTTHPSPFSFGVLAGYSIVGLQGPTVGLEVGLGPFCVEAAGTLGTQKVTDIGIFNNNSFCEAYDYSGKSGFFSLGYVLNPSSKVQLMPKGGFSLVSIDGKELKGNNGEKEFDHTHVAQAFAALRASYVLGKHLQFFATPQYNFNVSQGDTYEIIKEADNTIKQWGSGIRLTVGLLFRF